MASKVTNFTDSLVIEAINASLAREYRVMDGRPIYRLVWSLDQIETRKGTFTDWYGSILIRQEHECVRDVKKYWYLNTPCWVLEKLIFMSRQRDMYDLLEELVKAYNGTYEPVYTFQREVVVDQKKEWHALPVDHEVVECIIHQLHNPTKLNEDDMRRIDEKEQAEEVAYFEDQMSEGERSSLFVFENSAFVSTEQLKFRQKLKLGETYSEQSSPITLA